MQLTFDDKSKEKILLAISQKNVPTKVLFDLDDGVGTLSKFGSCSMNVHFRFVLIEQTFPTPEYDEMLETNAGEFWMKGYSKMYINGENARIEYNKSYATNVLKTDNEIVDSNAEIVDFRGIEL
ncbi:Uncharacterized protein YqkB [Pilibacter termitis]|uniref:Uncharacterized protein YqkB n=1 Tax=Pilibacter termitis TaxID=263852 RepID=A0A1T4N9A5_9ENTE|nr:iron-sulfur cluster biosynthesis family protein [Pilibacter termitis]SJZ75824.1 Uncharacterized protein YqkB [Pilibacter termitis]